MDAAGLAFGVDCLLQRRAPTYYGACYNTACPPAAFVPQESLRGTILADLAKAAKLPAKVILRAGRGTNG